MKVEKGICHLLFHTKQFNISRLGWPTFFRKLTVLADSDLTPSHPVDITLEINNREVTIRVGARRSRITSTFSKIIVTIGALFRKRKQRKKLSHHQDATS